MGETIAPQEEVSAIALASLATLAIIGGVILYKWLQYKAYDNPLLAHSFLTSSLNIKQKEILHKYFKFYNYLPKRSKDIFEFRVAKFMSLRQFIPRQMQSVSEEMKVLISASAIMVTFGYPRVFLSYFKYIVVFPDQFFSGAGQRYHKGEVNPREKAVVLSWRHFVEGYASSEGVNLGIHEMAHALQLENAITNHEFNFIDEEAADYWQRLTDLEIAKIRNGDISFFRAYAATDHSEFFAVCAENFFERPGAFAGYNYELYNCLKRIFRQDPLMLYKEL